MVSMKLYPAKLSGKVVLPPSKSMAHRAIICASLADGRSKIKNIDISDDIKSTIEAMKVLGAEIEIAGDDLYIIGLSKENRKVSMDSSIEIDKNRYIEILSDIDSINIVDCNESGSTLRFIIPIFSVLGVPARYIGRGKLGSRPLDTYYDIFKVQGIDYNCSGNGLDLTVIGNLKAGEFHIRGDISSQFISGLLFALPLAKRDSKIVITTELESRPYLDLTLSVLKEFGIDIQNNSYKEFIIKGNQKYRNCDYTVEGDYSQAAFFMCANALGADIKLLGLKEDSLQGDKVALDILERMGIESKFKNLELKNVGNDLVATTIDASQCPDIIPVIALVASLCKGETIIENAKRLRIKESDRLNSTKEELNKLGADIEVLEDSMRINGVSKLKGGVKVWSHNDHRIAMMLSIASNFCEREIIIEDSECIKKSYPNFYRDLYDLGGNIDGWNLGK